MAQASPHHQTIQGVDAGPGAMVLAGTFHGCSFDHDDIATRRAKVLDHLRLTDPADDRAELQSQKGQRVPGTCQWIQDHPEYRKWVQGDCPQLWISGRPGTGKTMLSIFITESIEESNEHVTYFFCRHDDEKRNTEMSVLRGLLVRLLRTVSDQSFNQYVWPSFLSEKAASYTLSGTQTIWNIFQVLVTSQDSTPIFCILDGLDECDEHSLQRLTGRFHGLFTTDNTRHSAAALRLAVISRDQSPFCGFSNLQLEESDSHIRHDIELFIASNIRDALSHKTSFGEIDLWFIELYLYVLSEGSFLWIGFVVKDLSRYDTLRQVMNVLERTPKGLGEQHRRILRHIFEDHEGDWQHIQEILAWVTLAFEPLTLPQLARAVMGSVSLENQEHINELLTYCNHLLAVNLETRVVRLVHTSAREFLVQSHSSDQSDSVTDRTHVDDGHRMITRICLKILEHTAQSDVLRPYAIQFTLRHMKACKAADISRELSRPFFTDDTILRSQWEIWRLSQSDQWNFPVATPSALHIAAYWGIIPWAQQQLQARSVWEIMLRRSHLETEDTNGMTPLAIAVSRQDEHMVEWLLQQGAIVHLEMPRDGYSARSSLAKAFSCSGFMLRFLESWLGSPCQRIASRLLHHLNRPNWRSFRMSAAFECACSKLSTEIVQWILHHFPPPEKFNRTIFECAALVSAAGRGHVQIVDHLIDCGADIYSTFAGTTAFAQVFWVRKTANRERILALLFDERDRRLQTTRAENQRNVLLQPIHSPCPNLTQSFSNMWKVVSNRGWFKALKGKENALLMAICTNQSLRLCLERGNVGRFSDSGYPGHAEMIGAVLSGRVESVLLLLQNGANPNTINYSGNSVLNMATRYGDWDVAELLLNHDAEVNFVGYAKKTPLTEAVRIKVMLSWDRLYFKAVKQFFPSFRKGKLKTVSKLLDRGACTQWRTSDGDTALSLAANSADADTVSILVERGARITIEDQIWDRGLWRWFIILKILMLCGKLSNGRCSKLLAARLRMLTKRRTRSEPWVLYYHLEEDPDAALEALFRRKPTGNSGIVVIIW